MIATTTHDFSILEYFRAEPYVDFAGDELSIFKLSGALAINTHGRVRYCVKNKTWYGYNGDTWIPTDTATILHGIHMAIWAAERNATAVQRKELHSAHIAEAKEPGRYTLFIEGAKSYIEGYQKWARHYTQVKFLKDVLWLMKNTNHWRIHTDEIKQHVAPELLRYTHVDTTETIVSQAMPAVKITSATTQAPSQSLPRGSSHPVESGDDWAK